MLPPPSDLGFPERFSSWRPDQEAVLIQTQQWMHTRFKVPNLPTGWGKSPWYIAYALLHGGRTAVLTATLALQDQLRGDFEGLEGYCDLRGMANYECLLEDFTTDRKRNCDQGPCLDGERCRLRSQGCLYYDQVELARHSSIVQTNYAAWFAHRRKVLRGDGDDPGLGKFDLLICDEAHDAAEALSSYLRVELRGGELDPYAPVDSVEIDGWAAWAVQASDRVRRRMQEAPRWDRRRLRGELEKLDRLAGAGEDWVVQRIARGGWSFQPKWPAKYAEEWLFHDIPEVLLVSATIRPKHLEYLGIPERDYSFIERPSSFPTARRPIYTFQVPSAARCALKWDAPDYVLRRWLERIDSIIEDRLDRKGIIHTVSYDRAEYIVKNSRWKQTGVFIQHDRGDLREAMEQFESADAPAILVSPVAHTGVNFPYEAARYQIVAKVPFPDTKDAVVKVRCEEDKDYRAMSALEKIEQMAGRIMRAADDYGETFVVDDQVGWLLGKYPEFTSRSFRAAVKRISADIPAPWKGEEVGA